MFTRTIEVGLRWVIVALCSVALMIAFVPAQAKAVDSDEAASETSDVESGAEVEEDGALVAQADAGSNSRAAIQALTLNKTFKTTVPLRETICYSFATTSNCTLRIKGSASESFWTRIYDSQGNEFSNMFNAFGKNDLTNEATFDRTYYLNTGSYYIEFEDSYGCGPLSLTLTASLSSSDVSFNETIYGDDNDMASARPINFDTLYKGQFSENNRWGDVDYYKVTLTEVSQIMLSASTNGVCGMGAGLCNSQGDWITDAFRFQGSYSETTGKASIFGVTDALEPGTYYIKLDQFKYDRGGCVYSFKARAVHTMYRLYNPNSGEHFYTESATERDAVWNAGWNYEGEGWTAPVSSKTPVYRLYSGTDHHYTTSAAERDSLKKSGWKYEGIGWYSDDSKTTPLYRQFNPNVNPKAKKNNSGSHNYTTSKRENDNLVKSGWKAEGIGWYGC